MEPSESIGGNRPASTRSARYSSLPRRCVWPAGDAKSLSSGPHRFLAAATDRLGPFAPDGGVLPLLLPRRISDDAPTQRVRRPARSSVIGEPLNHPFPAYDLQPKGRGDENPEPILSISLTG